MSQRLTLALLLLTSVGACADELPSRTVTLQGEYTVAQALAAMEKQTGIAIADRRDDKKDPKLTLNLEKAAFWPALDAIAREAGAAVSLYQADGVLALVRRSGKPSAPVYSSVFRATPRRLTLLRDLDTGAHTCEALVEFTWEPWFQPLLFEVRSYTASFAPNGGKSFEGRGGNADQVRGRPALEVDLRSPAPGRKAETVSFKGTLTAVGAAKMLTVRFDKLRPQTQTQDGVAVSLRRADTADPERWEVEVGLLYPPGGPTFESYQDWLVNNRIWLEKGKAGKLTKLEPAAEQQRVLQLDSRSARIVYYFKETRNGPRLGDAADWTLLYRTPGPLLRVTAPFELKDLPLP